jgi:hypothetical protein
VVLGKKVRFVMNVGDMVTVNRCDECPSLVGKVFVVKGFSDTKMGVSFKYGRGRPQKNRPEFISVNDLSLTDKPLEVVDNG